jgi:hypothetical protein
MPILPKGAASTARAKTVSPSDNGWVLLGWVGLAFMAMGLTDVALGWYPSSFGNAEWEFGAISASLNGFALPTLGLYLILASTTSLEKRVLSRIVSIALFVLALTIAGLAATYATVVPLALQSVAADPLLTAGMKKAIIKAGVLFVAYGTLFIAGGRRAWSSTKR